jgi:hypothetical protein
MSAKAEWILLLSKLLFLRTEMIKAFTVGTLYNLWHRELA